MEDAVGAQGSAPEVAMRGGGEVGEESEGGADRLQSVHLGHQDVRQEQVRRIPLLPARAVSPPSARGICPKELSGLVLCSG